MTPNRELLQEVVEWVELQDQLPQAQRQWMQDDWLMEEEDRVKEMKHEPGCGTAYCVAGYVAAKTVPELKHSFAVTIEGERVYSWDVAQEALGLTGSQADVLFSPTNSAADVRKTVEWIVGETL